MQNTLNLIRRRMGVILLLAMGALLMALPAFATPPTPEEAAGTAISDAVTQATNVLTTNYPLILGVTVAWVVFKIAQRLVRRAAG